MTDPTDISTVLETTVAPTYVVNDEVIERHYKLMEQGKMPKPAHGCLIVQHKENMPFGIILPGSPQKNSWGVGTVVQVAPDAADDLKVGDKVYYQSAVAAKLRLSDENGVIELVSVTDIADGIIGFELETEEGGQQ